MSDCTHDTLPFATKRLGGEDERIFAGRKRDRLYSPDPAAGRAIANLAHVVGGRAYPEGNVGGAVGAARLFLGRGPSVGVGEGLHVVALSRWLVLASLLPLLFLLWRRNIV